jgi:hypothetical protein
MANPVGPFSEIGVRLPPTKLSPSQVEGDCFYRRLVSAPVTLPDSRQPDRHSIPIALGPAQFNEFYRQRPPPKSFPLCGFFFWGRAPPIECSSLSVAILGGAYSQQAALCVLESRSLSPSPAKGLPFLRIQATRDPAQEHAPDTRACGQKPAFPKDLDIKRSPAAPTRRR